MPDAVAISFGFVEMVIVVPRLIVYRALAPKFGVSPIGKDVFKPKGFIFFLVVAVIAFQLLSSVSGNIVLYLFGFVPADALPLSISAWWIGNMITVTVIGTILLGVLTPVVERLGLTVHGIIT